MGNQVVTTIENASLYGYSPTDGRLETLANSADTFSYGYVANSNLLETVTKAASGENPALVATRTYEATRDTLAAIENKAGTLVRSKYDYFVVNGGVNSLVQRMGVQTTFNLGAGHLANAGNTSWGYDNLGQVTSAAAPGTPADRAYQYDTIGNRIEARDGVTAVTGTANYAANLLNQYTLASGVTLPTAPAPAPHDADGNLRFDGGVNKDNQPREYLWDAENRLIEVKASTGTTLERNLFDAGTRKIATTVNGVTTVNLYDAWNCIAEYTGTTLSKTRLWGMDLSGSMQGAGGVGGLLLITDHSALITHHYPTYDGNGNVSEYLAADGSTAAHFEYDPFGNIVKESYSEGFNASSFTYKFSTKPLDLTTGLYYYLYKYYDPLTGRWLSRDPIQERGGINPYGFVRNNGVTLIDLLGMEPTIPPYITLPPISQLLQPPVVDPVDPNEPPPVDPSLDPKTYNCAGSATRTYKDVPTAEAAESLGGELGYSRDCDSSCVDPFVKYQVLRVTYKLVNRKRVSQSPTFPQSFHATSGSGVQPNKWGAGGPVCLANNDYIGPGTTYSFSKEENVVILTVVSRKCYCICPYAGTSIN